MGAEVCAVTKYRAKPVVVDGIRFHSTKEARRYGELKLLERAGQIQGLCLQPEYDLHVGSEKIGVYRADFEYAERGRHVVEDVKSEPTKTPLWRWKVKHLKAQYGIEVVTT